MDNFSLFLDKSNIFNYFCSPFFGKWKIINQQLNASGLPKPSGI